MPGNLRQRLLVLATASLAAATGAAYAAQAPQSAGTAATSHSAEASRSDDLPDKPNEELSVVDKAQIVTAVQSGGTTRAEAAVKYEVSEREIDIWKREVLDGDRSASMGQRFTFRS
ncbi:DUF1153 domain-containing protein [Streptomyces sp. NPDC057445]|uniref:DUF1153 domain-containing protein n=1 Tax=Streptomyces sp. NPDC057445 TaxID=3346136 RepID=UPI0036A58401